MLRLSKLADYAMVLLGYLSQVDSKSMSSAELACLTRLPEPTVSKLLKLLTKANLLRSIRGTKGGYMLESSLKNISLAQVIVAVDGPIHLTHCLSEDAHCAISSYCLFKEGWLRVNASMMGLLQRTMLEDMINHSSIVNSMHQEV